MNNGIQQQPKPLQQCVTFGNSVVPVTSTLSVFCPSSSMTRDTTSFHQGMMAIFASWFSGDDHFGCPPINCKSSHFIGKAWWNEVSCCLKCLWVMSTIHFQNLRESRWCKTRVQVHKWSSTETYSKDTYYIHFVLKWRVGSTLTLQSRGPPEITSFQ